MLNKWLIPIIGLLFALPCFAQVNYTYNAPTDVSARQYPSVIPCPQAANSCAGWVVSELVVAAGGSDGTGTWLNTYGACPISGFSAGVTTAQLNGIAAALVGENKNHTLQTCTSSGFTYTDGAGTAGTVNPANGVLIVGGAPLGHGWTTGCDIATTNCEMMRLTDYDYPLEAGSRSYTPSTTGGSEGNSFSTDDTRFIIQENGNNTLVYSLDPSTGLTSATFLYSVTEPGSTKGGTFSHVTAKEAFNTGEAESSTDAADYTCATEYDLAIWTESYVNTSSQPTCGSGRTLLVDLTEQVGTGGSLVLPVGPCAFGKVSTSGTAVTWVSGTEFVTTWPANLGIIINGVQYTIATVNSTTSITLTTSAGTQTSVAYNAVGLCASDDEPTPSLTDQEISLMSGEETGSNVQCYAMAYTTASSTYGQHLWTWDTCTGETYEDGTDEGTVTISDTTNNTSYSSSTALFNLHQVRMSPGGAFISIAMGTCISGVCSPGGYGFFNWYFSTASAYLSISQGNSQLTNWGNHWNPGVNVEAYEKTVSSACTAGYANMGYFTVVANDPGINGTEISTLSPSVVKVDNECGQDRHNSWGNDVNDRQPWSGNHTNDGVSGAGPPQAWNMQYGWQNEFTIQQMPSGITWRITHNYIVTNDGDDNFNVWAGVSNFSQTGKYAMFTTDCGGLCGDSGGDANTPANCSPNGTYSCLATVFLVQLPWQSGAIAPAKPIMGKLLTGHVSEVQLRFTYYSQDSK